MPIQRGQEPDVWVQQGEYKRAGGVLADIRKRAGLTQQAVAKRLRKPQSFVSSYENGQRRIDVLELLLIGKALEMDPAAIIKELYSTQARQRGTRKQGGGSRLSRIERAGG